MKNIYLLYLFYPCVRTAHKKGGLAPFFCHDWSVLSIFYLFYLLQDRGFFCARVPIRRDCSLSRCIVYGPKNWRQRSHTHPRASSRALRSALIVSRIVRWLETHFPSPGVDCGGSLPFAP